MNIRNTHLEVAEKLLLSYAGGEPFANYLKKYFSLNKKHGSRDRKQIAALCYGYFRLGNGTAREMNIQEKIKLGYILTQGDEIGEEGNSGLLTRLQTAVRQFDPSQIFPFKMHLSAEIDPGLFNSSFLKQPHLYLRIRPGNEDSVVKKLKQHDIPFKRLNNHCIQVNNATRLQDVLNLNKEALIQDRNSQKIAELFEKIPKPTDKPLRIWDCCAASGGKSILAGDLFKNIELTVSDKRKSILHNLKNRLNSAGIKNYHSTVLDLSKPVTEIAGQPFDLIIADVPCSGSGTWARTPEQLSSFQESQINDYASLQRSIIRNASKHLQPGGFLVYITCSVFKEENEENVEKITDETGMKLIAQEYFKGYDIQADTLFGAVMHI